jgi:hypothetical protein
MTSIPGGGWGNLSPYLFYTSLITLMSCTEPGQPATTNVNLMSKCIADKGRRSTFQLMLHEEGRWCCCLSKRPALLLADEGRWCCCLSMRAAGAAACRWGPRQGASRQGLRQGGSWCAGQRRRTEASSCLSRDAGTKKRKGFFLYITNSQGKWCK